MVEISHGDLKVWNDDGDDESLKTPKNDNDSRAGEWDSRRGLRLPQTTQPASNTQGVHRGNEFCLQKKCLQAIFQSFCPRLMLQVAVLLS